MKFQKKIVRDRVVATRVSKEELAEIKKAARRHKIATAIFMRCVVLEATREVA